MRFACFAQKCCKNSAKQSRHGWPYHLATVHLWSCSRNPVLLLRPSVQTLNGWFAAHGWHWSQDWIVTICASSLLDSDQYRLSSLEEQLTNLSIECMSILSDRHVVAERLLDHWKIFCDRFCARKVFVTSLSDKERHAPDKKWSTQRNLKILQKRSPNDGSFR